MCPVLSTPTGRAETHNRSQIAGNATSLCPSSAPCCSEYGYCGTGEVIIRNHPHSRTCSSDILMVTSSASAGATHFTLIHSILACQTRSAKLLNIFSPITRAFFPTSPTTMGTRLNGVSQSHPVNARELMVSCQTGPWTRVIC